MTQHASAQEKILTRLANGLVFLAVNSLLILVCFALFAFGFILNLSFSLRIVILVVSGLYGFVIGPILFAGLKIVKPNEALVLTLFGKYYGTIKSDGFFWVNPFTTAVNPVTTGENNATSGKVELRNDPTKAGTALTLQFPKKKLSLKAMTLNNEKQKINDALGNPVVIGVVVVWRIINTAKAVFNVENYVEYLSIQCDSALRNIVRLYPYDAEDDERSLRGSSSDIAKDLMLELQSKVEIAGLEILEARITHLSYAPEIAAAMLQRQQAVAIVAARQKIVEGAVGMVEMALDQMNKNGVITLDEERKASMVSNLMVVLCGNRDVQPVVNSGSLY